MYQTLHSHHNHYIPRAASIRGLLDHPFAHLQTSIYTNIPRLFYRIYEDLLITHMYDYLLTTLMQYYLWRSSRAIVIPHPLLRALSEQAFIAHTTVVGWVSMHFYLREQALLSTWAEQACATFYLYLHEQACISTWAERTSATFYLSEQAFVSPSWTHTASFLGKSATCTGIIISLSKSLFSELLLHSADLARCHGTRSRWWYGYESCCQLWFIGDECCNDDLML